METIGKKSSSEKNVPHKKFRSGPVVATIWNNESVNKDNEKVSFKTISFERTYKDKNDEWQSTNSLRVGDLPKATLVLNKAYEFLMLNTEEEA